MSDNEQSSSSGSEEEEIDEEYHKARLQRIQRNKALLEGLGSNQPIAKALTPIKPSSTSSVFDNDEIIVEKLANLQKISSNETLEYANQVLLPIVYYATYEDQEYLDQLCEKGSEKAIKNLVVIYNTATSKNYELNFSFYWEF
ncbi:hypothetical protein ABK040_016832 [Willaertia magna]